MGNKSSSLAAVAAVATTRTATLTVVETSILSTPVALSSAILSSTTLPAESIYTVTVQASAAAIQPAAAASISISSIIVTTTFTEKETLLETVTQTASNVQETAAMSAAVSSSMLFSSAEVSSSMLFSSAEVSSSILFSSAEVSSSMVFSPMSQSGGVSRVSATGSALAASASNTPSGTILMVGRTQPKSGPFSPEAAILGGVPTKSLDVPVTAVFLVLFIIGAVTHFTIHELNGKRGHKFHLSDMVFDFCMVRTVTCTMRIVWAFRPRNNRVVLAAEIFENAGVIVLFAVNVVLTQRILRAIHPQFGWNPIVSKSFFALLVSVPIVIVWNIVSLTLEFFTLNPKIQTTARHLLFAGGSWNLFLCLLPVVVVGSASSIPSPTPMEKFGAGRFRYKIILLLFSSFTLSVGTIVRIIGAAWIFPLDAPGLIDSKTTFYTTGFMLEIIVVFVYAVGRIDLKFHVPDGCTGPGDYSRSSEKQSDEEALFQEVDVKMRMSDSQTLMAQNYDDGRSMSSVSREQVEQAIEDLRLNSQIAAQPVDTDGSELLLYSFQVKKPDYGYTEPKRP